MRSRWSVVVTLWALACVAVFAAGQLGVIDTDSLSMVPATLADHPRSLVTNMFAHAGVLHLAGNMLALLSIGPAVERQLGSIFTFVVLSVSGLAGGIAYLLIESGSHTGVLGASGSVFGVMGAYLAMHVVMRSGQVGQCLVMIVINFSLGLVNPGIAWQAHAGGLGAGAVLGLVWAPVGLRLRQSRDERRAAAGSPGRL